MIRSDFDFFCVDDRSTEEITLTLPGISPEPLREVPSSTLRFSRDVVQNLPTVHNPAGIYIILYI